MSLGLRRAAVLRLPCQSDVIESWAQHLVHPAVCDFPRPAADWALLLTGLLQVEYTYSAMGLLQKPLLLMAGEAGSGQGCRPPPCSHALPHPAEPYGTRSPHTCLQILPLHIPSAPAAFASLFAAAIVLKGGSCGSDGGKVAAAKQHAS